jgi:hypothetical protein
MQVPLPDNVPNNDQLMKFHHRVVGDLIDTLVRNVDELECVADELIDIGASHARYYDDGVKVGLGFPSNCPSPKAEKSCKIIQSKFWNAFAESLIECTMEWGDKHKRSDELRKAWASVAAFTSEKLKHGLNEQRRRQQEQTQISNLHTSLVAATTAAASVAAAAAVSGPMSPSCLRPASTVQQRANSPRQ